MAFVYKQHIEEYAELPQGPCSASIIAQRWEARTGERLTPRRVQQILKQAENKIREALKGK